MRIVSEQQPRPRVHFTPRQGWINDPNGLIYLTGQYHLFAQHYPHDTSWGAMHWLHATSDDLIHWHEQPIALYPNERGMKFSGSSVLDRGNRSGLSTDGRDPLILVYTNHGQQEEQAIAWSTDGLAFTEWEKNPIIPNPGLHDFRDPKVFQMPGSGHWHLVLTAGQQLFFYQSADLLHWHQTGTFVPDGQPSGSEGKNWVLECPDCFAVPAPDGRVVWVLLLSHMVLDEPRKTEILYWLGEFDGLTFRPFPSSSGPFLFDPGPDHYAPVTFAGLPEPLTLGWGSNWAYKDTLPCQTYCGQMTLARRLALIKTKNGLRLTQEPVLPTGLLPAKPDVMPGQLDVTIEFYGSFSCRLFNASGESFVISLDDNQYWQIDRSHGASQPFWPSGLPDWYEVIRSPRLADGPSQMRLVYDQTSIEIFADQGLLACHLLVMPGKAFDQLEMAGAARVQH